MIKKMVLFFILLTNFNVNAAEPTKIDPEVFLKVLADHQKKNISLFNEYTALITKREAFNKVLRPKEVIFLKQRDNDIYLKWLSGPYQGQEALFSNRISKHKVIAHRGGLLSFITLKFTPEGKTATEDQHYTIKDTGLKRIYEISKTIIEKGIELKDITINDMGREITNLRKLKKIEVIFKKPYPFIRYTVKDGESLFQIARKFNTMAYAIVDRNKNISDPFDIDEGDEIKVPLHPCYRAFIYIDEKFFIPVKMEIFDWDNLPYEEIEYRKVDFHVNLTDMDFSPENPEYNF